MKAAVALAIGITSISLAGCASIVHGTSQDVSIASEPSNARVEIDGQNYGKTPLTADLSRKNSHRIIVTKKGYKPYRTGVTTKASGWLWANILNGALVGMLIDASTGARYNLVPAKLQVDLVPLRWPKIEPLHREINY